MRVAKSSKGDRAGCSQPTDEADKTRCGRNTRDIKNRNEASTEHRADVMSRSRYTHSVCTSKCRESKDTRCCGDGEKDVSTAMTILRDDARFHSGARPAPRTVIEDDGGLMQAWKCQPLPTREIGTTGTGVDMLISAEAAQ